MSGRIGSGQVPLSKREQRDLSYSPEAIGLALHNRRVAEGLTRRELADRIRVNEGTVRHWEEGGMPVASARVLSYLYERTGAEELWRERALRGEAALKRVTETMAQYRDGVRRDLAERTNGACHGS